MAPAQSGAEILHFKKGKGESCTIWGWDFAFKERKGWILHNLGLRFCI